MAIRARRRSFFGRGPKKDIDDEKGQSIVRRWRAGDRGAFNDLFKEYRPLVYGVLYNLLHSDPDIEDVVQTAFLEVFRSLDRFEGRSRLSSWIARVALHVGYHHLRHRKSRPHHYRAEELTIDPVDPIGRGNPQTAVERREVTERVHAVLETIAQKKRTVFILNDLQGLPQEEIAEIVGSNVATVRTRLFYARREFWKKAGSDPVLKEMGPTGTTKDDG